MYSANEDFTVPLFWEFILVDPAYIHSEQHSLFNCNYRKQSLTIFTLSLGQAKHSTFIQITLYLLNYLALSRLSIVPDQVAAISLSLPIISRLSVIMVGEVGLEPTKPLGEGFTAPCNCRYATRPYLITSRFVNRTSRFIYWLAVPSFALPSASGESTWIRTKISKKMPDLLSVF